MAIEDDYIVIMCPHCGDQMDIPYVYDGTYELNHGDGTLLHGEYTNIAGCNNTFFVTILDGRLHVHSNKQQLENLLNKYFNK